MKITKITNRTTLFTVPENDTYDVNMALILGDKHNFIIDTGTGSGCAEAMLAQIDNDKPLIIINTHGDWDHVASNWIFEDKIIISHVLGRERIEKEWDNQIKWAKENNGYFAGEAQKCLPNLVFEGSLQFPEDGISLFHTPGHTDCCITIYDNVDKILHTGDNFGVVEGKAVLWGEDLADFKRLIETYQPYDFEICISGHSKPQTKEVITLLEVALAEAQKEKNENI